MIRSCQCGTYLTTYAWFPVCAYRALCRRFGPCHPLSAPDTDAPLDLWFTAGGVLTHPRAYDYEGLGFRYDAGRFSAGFDFVLNNDQKYEPSEPHMLGRYFDLLDGHVSVVYLYETF